MDGEADWSDQEIGGVLALWTFEIKDPKLSSLINGDVFGHIFQTRSPTVSWIFWGWWELFEPLLQLLEAAVRLWPPLVCCYHMAECVQMSLFHRGTILMSF